MADFGYGAGDEDNAELKKLEAEVAEDQDSYERWEKLLRTAEAQEGGLNRNSSPQAITQTRAIYDRFLGKFPLFFGFWKKYAELEFAIAGTEAAELVYERGVSSITNSVDLWTQYCEFKVKTSHDPDVIRELFERGADAVGLDYLSHPFWDKYLEFEARLEMNDRIFAILKRIVHLPTHQYSRYFERFTVLAHSRPTAELCPAEMLAQFRAEITMEAGNQVKSESEIDNLIRQRANAYHVDVFQKSQTETTKRWTYEAGIKRPYFHVTDLEEGELANWKKYLDFEEAEGDTKRIVFLYERCLVAAAYYDEFWLRYARWMLTQSGKTEEVRNIYQRASCLYAPILRPTVRLQWALFEEMHNRVDVAHAIYEAMLIPVPGHLETVVAWANSVRRHSGLEAAIEIYRNQVESQSVPVSAKASILAEWARLLWKVKDSPEDARALYQAAQQSYLDSRSFWANYLHFEIEQATNTETEDAQITHIKQLIDTIRKKSNLPAEAVKELCLYYMSYLLERGSKDVAKEYLVLDREINGTISKISSSSVAKA